VFAGMVAGIVLTIGTDVVLFAAAHALTAEGRIY